MRTHFATILALAFALTGCDRDGKDAKEPDPPDKGVVRYKTSDPNLEPTMTLGPVEIRTTDGGPVVLRSQVEKQERAAAEKRRREAEAAREAAKQAEENARKQ